MKITCSNSSMADGNDLIYCLQALPKEVQIPLWPMVTASTAAISIN